MQQYELLEKLQQEIRQSAFDIRAEPQVLQAMEKGLLQESFMVTADQLFRRSYSRDIVSAKIDDQSARDMLLLYLSRGGLYDHLPEGLFFRQPHRGNRLITVADMASDYKLNKKREEEIRRFFMPVEHELFLHSLEVEKEENALLQGLQSGILNDYFNRFWNLPASIPAIFIPRLISLLPYAYRIAGNWGLTAQCFTHILNEEVKLVQLPPVVADASALAPPQALGEAALGIDMVSGTAFEEGEPAIEINIGPLLRSGLSDYLEGGERYTLLETLNRFFLPAGLDVKFSVQLPVEKMNMSLTKGEEPVLGYSSVL